MGHVQVERSQGVVTVTLAQALEAEAKAQTVNFGTKDTPTRCPLRRTPGTRIEWVSSWPASSVALRRRGWLSFHDLTSP
jgi:hypothetical protein